MQISKYANKQIKTLGIDYGRAKVGLAIGVNSLAEPLKTLRYKDIKILLKQVIEVIKVEKVDKVVVGISEGAMAEETKRFVSVISHVLLVPVETFDETLTSQDAQRLSREAGVSQKKRKNMEDAYAASIMLQNYIDSTP